MKYKMIWENEHSCDGIDCVDFEEAKAVAINCLIEWQGDERQRHPIDITTWTEKDIEEWDMFIANCYVRVDLYDDNENEIGEWYPSTEKEKEIGWLYYEELKVLEISIEERCDE